MNSKDTRSPGVSGNIDTPTERVLPVIVIDDSDAEAREVARKRVASVSKALARLNTVNAVAGSLSALTRMTDLGSLLSQNVLADVTRIASLAQTVSLAELARPSFTAMTAGVNGINVSALAQMANLEPLHAVQELTRNPLAGLADLMIRTPLVPDLVLDTLITGPLGKPWHDSIADAISAIPYPEPFPIPPLSDYRWPAEAPEVEHAECEAQIAAVEGRVMALEATVTALQRELHDMKLRRRFPALENTVELTDPDIPPNESPFHDS